MASQNIAISNENIHYLNKLIVIYKTQEEARLRRASPSKITPFQEVLNNAINKLGNTGKKSLKPNTRFQKTGQEIASVESSLEKLDSYIINVNKTSLIEELQKALEKEPGVLKVTRDFEVSIPETLDELTNTTALQTCDEIPSCDTGLPVCTTGTPSCTGGKISVCVYLSSDSPFPACLGDRRITTYGIYCETGFGPPLELPDDPYNTENWHFRKTGLLNAWNKTCSCPASIPENECNVKNHPELCTIGNPNIITAVLDNGFSVGIQPNTQGNPDLVNRWDETSSTNTIAGDDPFNYDSSDETSMAVFYDHGTAVALSNAANANNNISHAGIDWRSKIWAVRIGKGGGASFSNILSGFNYVISQVEIKNIQHFFVNLSYASLDCNKALITSINDFAGQRVKDHGGLITISSGNQGCFQDFTDVGSDVIVVGATSAASACGMIDVAGYSNYGKVTDIFSPSGFIVDNRNTGVEDFTLSKQTIHGTSFAAPSLAGFGTFLWSLNPSLTPDQLEKILKVSSFNSLSIFDDNDVNKDKILKSQSSQIKIDDAIDLQNYILDLSLSANPNSTEQDVFLDINKQITANATFSTLNEELKLEAIGLPQNAIFTGVSGIRSVSQIFSWTPSQSDLNMSFPVTFFVKNTNNKIIGVSKITLNVKARPNNSPTADAGTDRFVRKGDYVGLGGENINDPDGDQLTFNWVQIQGQSLTIPRPDVKYPIIRIPDTFSNQELIFRLTVDDSFGGITTDDISVFVGD